MQVALLLQCLPPLDSMKQTQTLCFHSLSVLGKHQAPYWWSANMDADIELTQALNRLTLQSANQFRTSLEANINLLILS